MEHWDWDWFDGPEDTHTVEEERHNAYDTSRADRHDDLLNIIRRDLKSLGDLTMNGEITPLGDEVMLDDVSLSIASPYFHPGITLDPRWSEVKESFAYYNERGYEYVPNPASYVEDPAVTRMVAKVMARLAERGGEAFGKPVEAKKETSVKRQPQSLPDRMYSALMQPASAITGAGMVVTGPEDPWFYAHASVFAVSFGAHLVVSNYTQRKSPEALDRKRHAEAVEEWNRNPKQAFYDLFDDINERAAFLEHLLRVCAKSNISFDGSIKVTPRYDTEHRLGRVLKTPLIQFTGHRVWKYIDKHDDKETLLFDGEHLYLVPDRGVLPDRVCPM